MSRHAHSTICLGCRSRERNDRHYLCRECWFALDPITRARLRQKDEGARDRLFQMLSALRRGVRLERITVSA